MNDQLYTEQSIPDIGDYMLVATRGWQAGVIRFITRSKVNHAMILVSPGRVIEAQPAGAHETDLSEYNDMYQWWSTYDLTIIQRNAIVASARRHLGAPYSWVDGACVAIAHIFKLKLPYWIRWRLARPDRLMCSQFVDLCYYEADVHLFNDHRLFGDVSPGDLMDIIQ